MGNESNLRELINKRFADHRLIIVSNRQPYAHQFREGRSVLQRAVSGLVTGLEPIAKACDALWVAHGDGTADRMMSDGRGVVGIPEDCPEYRLKRVFLTKDEIAGYYYGLSNEALWPLCHISFVRPTFRAEDMAMYRHVNQKFANAILSEIGTSKAFVWIQDYHFALLPRYLKTARPDLVVGQFWHIPWPNPEVFRICSWREEILDGLLGNDLLGFQLRYHADNFLATCAREIDSHSDQDRTTVTRRAHKTKVHPFPIGVDFEGISEDAASPAIAATAEELRKKLRLEGVAVIAGVDRVDYTKGIPERLLAISRVLEKYPDCRKKFVFVQVGAINPFDRESFADSITQALYMDRTEKESRLRRMREYLAETNVFHWASGFVTELTKLQGGAQHETAWAKVSV